MKKYIISLLLSTLFSYTVFSNEAGLDFSKKVSNYLQSEKNSNRFRYNPYENIISGSAAFLIGNIGNLLTDSTLLKLTYSGVQTIGIINISRGIYEFNSPSLKQNLLKMATQDNDKISKKEFTYRLLRDMALEKRAKRLSLFYGTSFLALQYYANVFIFDTPDSIHNIYLFLGSVNLIASVYSALVKSDEEESFFGKSYDLHPFFIPVEDNFKIGVNLNIKF